MAAPVLPINLYKLPSGPSPLTPEQSYWKSFKNPLHLPSPANNPINNISAPLPSTSPLVPTSDLFAVTTGPRVQLLSSRTRKLVKTISRFDDVAHSAEIRRDGRVLVAGDESGTIQVFDIASRAILKTWREHKQPVWTTKFSPSEMTTVMSASDDRTVRLWDLPTEASITTFAGHTDYVRSGAFMPGQASGLVVSGSYDQTVRLWDPRVPERAVMTFKHAAPIESVLSMPTGTTLLAAADNQVSILDIVSGRPVQILRNHQKTVTSLCLASNSTRLAAGGLDGHLKIFETAGWNLVFGTKYPSPILALSIVPSPSSAREDRHIAVGLQSGMLSIKTRISGSQKIKDRAREKEMQALLAGAPAPSTKTGAMQSISGIKKRLRGRNFNGEGADVIIRADPRPKSKKIPRWQRHLHNASYAAALDSALAANDSVAAVTTLIALRHRSALRAALSGHDDLSLQPVLLWLNKHVIDPRHVALCADVGGLLLDLYAANMGASKMFDDLMRRLHGRVRQEVDRAQQAAQTEGMLGLLMGA